ncbi:GGDEF domain-containing protein [Vibrio genomosp. F10]|uniref:GGDEF domain-containing protein n=1 Tax=Vibrio genomosp. F10 TaxID=723171 RepID=UPI00035F1258|nr:GGDEF domain-containing protein [Vibrio genomosp. F10]OEE94640.1 diguanylate cyclase [Vibrio genomosp. F10 str. 9ZD137]
MLLVSISMKMLSHLVEVDSHYDFIFESNSLFITAYIYFISRKVLHSNRILKIGLLMLVFNMFYDVITEIKVLGELADKYELIDTFLEDGILQISYLIIAIGVTRLLNKVYYENTIDELTGLYNRKKLNAISKPEFDIVYLDINDLKSVNDTKGHAVGDLLIIRFSQALLNAKHRGEKAFRIGGDEFVVIVDPGRAQEYVDSVIRVLKGEPITFSYGFETTTLDNMEQALNQADLAMYKMKKKKRSV